MAKKAKKKSAKKKANMKPYKPVEEKTDPNAVNEKSVSSGAANEREESEDDDLTPEQMKELKEALKNADPGETITLEEFKESMARWISILKSTKGSE